MFKITTKSCHWAVYRKVQSKYTVKPLSQQTRFTQTQCPHSIQNSHFVLLVLCGVSTYLIWSSPSLAKCRQGIDIRNTLLSWVGLTSTTSKKN